MVPKSFLPLFCSFIETRPAREKIEIHILKPYVSPKGNKKSPYCCRESLRGENDLQKKMTTINESRAHGCMMKQGFYYISYQKSGACTP